MEQSDYFYGQEDATHRILALLRERMWNAALVAYSSRTVAASSKESGTRRLCHGVADIYDGIVVDFGCLERTIIRDAGMNDSACAWSSELEVAESWL